MKRIIFVLLFFWAFFSVEAQNTGYLGRHLGISYSNNFNVALENETSNSEMGLNVSHVLALDMTVGRRHSFCLGYQYIRTGFELSTDFYETSNGGAARFTYIYRGDPMILQSQGISLGLKIFRRNKAFAPVGGYKKFEVLYYMNKATYDETAFEYYNTSKQAFIASTLGKGEYTFGTVGFAFSLGRQKMIGDRVILDYGARACINPSFDGAGYYPSRQIAPGLDYAAVFRPDVNSRLFLHEFINLHIGIGFLAF